MFYEHATVRRRPAWAHRGSEPSALGEHLDRIADVEQGSHGPRILKNLLYVDSGTPAANLAHALNSAIRRGASPSALVEERRRPHSHRSGGGRSCPGGVRSRTVSRRV